MREAIHKARCFAGRFKFNGALLLMFLSGALLAIGACDWRYSGIIERGTANYEHQIARLTADVDMERETNRSLLAKLIAQVGENAQLLDKIADKAQTTAATVKSAAKTAKAASINAANANIRVTEIVPRAGLQLKENIK